MKRENYIDRWSHKIATYIFTTVSQETTSGAWVVEYEEIFRYFGINVKQDKELLNAICDVLDKDFSLFIADYELVEEGFDVNLWTNFCCNEVDFEDELWEE